MPIDLTPAYNVFARRHDTPAVGPNAFQGKDQYSAVVRPAHQELGPAEQEDSPSAHLKISYINVGSVWYWYYSL